MEPVGVSGFLSAVEVQASHAAPAASPFHHAPSATSTTAAAMALSGESPSYPGSTALEAAAFLPSGPVDRGGSAGTAFLDLPVQGAPAETAPLSVLPSPEDVAPHEMGFPTAPTLAGRKRSQPTGGWGLQVGDGGGTSSHESFGPDVRRQGDEHEYGDVPAEGHRRQQQPLGGNHAVGAAERPPSPSAFVLRGGTGASAGAAAAAGGVQADTACIDPSAAGSFAGRVTGTTTRVAAAAAASAAAAAAAAEENEIDHDVGESPVAFPLRSATKQQIGSDGGGGLPMGLVAGAATAALAAVAPAVPTAAAAAAFAGAAAAAVGGVDGMADPVSCLGDYNFSFEELNKMSKRYPTVNTLRAQTPMPLLGWLTRELDMSQYDMRSLIMRHPRLMAYRVTSHVAPKTKWLRERLGLGQPALRKLVTTYPAVLSRSVEKNLEPKFKWLEERLGASQEEVAVLIRRFPMIFGYSTTQNLEPTVAFFTADMSGEQHEIKSAVMSCPSILSRSLDKRMMPRTKKMQDKKIEPRFGPHKWVVSTYTDAQFTRWLEGRGS